MIWAGIGISYLRSGRSPLTWLPFVISMVSFAVLFFGLTLVATNSTLFDGQTARNPDPRRLCARWLWRAGVHREYVARGMGAGKAHE